MAQLGLWPWADSRYYAWYTPWGSQKHPSNHARTGTSAREADKVVPRDLGQLDIPGLDSESNTDDEILNTS